MGIIMERNAKKYMGIELIFASMFFFFNPDVIIIDIVPNFIGYILLCIGLSQLSAMNDVLEEAYIGFRRMIFVDIAKILSLFLLFGIFKGPEQAVSMLLFTFVFGVIEFIVLIPAVVKLFDGVMYLASRLPTESVVFETKKVGGKTKLEKLKIFTVAFIIIKTVLAVLPEASSLAIDGQDSFNNSQSIYNFIVLFRTFAFGFAFILGVIWLVNAISMVYKIRKDSTFIDAVKHKYNTEISIKDSLFIQKDMKTIVILFSVAIVFFIDFHVDFYNIIPNFVCAGLLILSAVNLKSYSKYKVQCIVSASIFAIISAFAEYFSNKFNLDYSPGLIYKSIEAASVYTKLLVFSALESLAFITTVIFIILAFKEIIATHTGFSIGGDDHINKPQIAELHKSLRKKLYTTGGLAVLAAVTHFLYDISIMYKSYNNNSFLIIYSNVAWILDFVVVLIFIISFIRTLFNIYDEIRSKYILM